MTDAQPGSHIPILTDTIVEHLQLRPGDRCIDATVNGGGHAAALLERTAPNGKLLGVDRDPVVLRRAHERLQAEVDCGRLTLVQSDFRHLSEIASANGFAAVQGIVFDLGLSSFHLDASERGFSIARDEALDMRFDPEDTSSPTAADLLRSAGRDELAHIFQRYGEERFARRIAAAISERREPVQTTAQLVELITAALPGRIRWRASRSAARIFQALRIAVNDELEAVAEALPQALALLSPGGRIAVLSFHSLEDRIVKQLFRREKEAGRLTIITKKPLRASEEEVERNPRAASAKLRVAQRCDESTTPK